MDETSYSKLNSKFQNYTSKSGLWFSTGQATPQNSAAPRVTPHSEELPKQWLTFREVACLLTFLSQHSRYYIRQTISSGSRCECESCSKLTWQATGLGICVSRINFTSWVQLKAKVGTLPQIWLSSTVKRGISDNTSIFMVMGLVSGSKWSNKICFELFAKLSFGKLYLHSKYIVVQSFNCNRKIPVLV